MSQLKIRQALEKNLAAMLPALATANENADFTPTTGTPYQKVNLLPAMVDNSTMGINHYREVGVFQVTLCYPISAGTNAAYTRAELVKTQFKRGTTLTQGGVDVVVIYTPSVSPPYQSGDRYCLPISIYYQSDIFI